MSARLVLLLIALMGCTAAPEEEASDAGLPPLDVDAGEPPIPTVWPNALGPSNSSAWLRENHARLTAIEPRVLVLDVVQRDGMQAIKPFVEGLVEAIAEQSRHRAYADPEANPFVRYQVDRIIDLKSADGAEYPDFWPPKTSSGWDVGALFGEEFAPLLGYEDPDVPGRFLTMCEIFERGLVHELWIAADAGDRAVYENQSRVQIYDENLSPIPGSFDNCTNGCFHDPRQRVSCGVTVRMQEINKSRGVGCATHAAGHTFEHLRFTIPYLRDNATRFLGFELDDRHGLPLEDLYACPYEAGLCVEFPTPGQMTNGPLFEGEAFTFDGWGEACGSVHFPPNARAHYDYYSDVPTLSSCEAYGTGTESDPTSEYTSSVVQQYEQAHGDCGGGWMIYWGQSMPGFGNAAKDARGEPMLNWWPFLFY